MTTEAAHDDICHVLVHYAVTSFGVLRRQRGWTTWR